MNTNSGELTTGITISVVNFFEPGLSLLKIYRSYQMKFEWNLPCDIN